jgi:hypothetical protein
MMPGFKGAGYDKTDDQNVNNSVFEEPRRGLTTASNRASTTSTPVHEETLPTLR